MKLSCGNYLRSGGEITTTNTPGTAGGLVAKGKQERREQVGD